MVVPEEEFRVVPLPLSTRLTWFREVPRALQQARVQVNFKMVLQYDMRVGQCILIRLKTASLQTTPSLRASDIELYSGAPASICMFQV